MKLITRRSFVETVGFGLSTIGGLTGLTSTAEAQLVYNKSDWKMAQFETLLRDRATVKQVYDIRQIGEGKFLNNIKNSLNGLQFGFGVARKEIKVVAALHGPPNMLNFNDDAWLKYRLGEFLQVNDPMTGSPAVRNIYFPGKGFKETDLDAEQSLLQDTSIETLQSRGVTFLSCHTATEEQVRILVKQRALKEPVEDIVNDLQSHALPNVMIVPAMVAAICMLQSEGRFTYITA